MTTINVASYADAAATLSRSVTIPANATGDRLVMLVTVPSSTVTIPSGWTNAGLMGSAFPKVYCLYRDLAASIGTTVTVATAASIKLAAVTFKINAGEFQAGVGPEIETSNSATSTTPDCGSFFVSWGQTITPATGAKTFLLTGFASTTLSAQVAAPSTYTTSAGATKVSGTSQPGIQVGWKDYNAITTAEDPAAWGAITSSAWTAFAVGIKSVIFAQPSARFDQAIGIPPDLAVQTADALAIGATLSQDAAATTSHVVNLPTPRTPGQRVCVWMVSTGATAAAAGQFPAGWTQSANYSTTFPTVIAAYRDVQAGDPDSITITSTNSVKSAFATCVMAAQAINARSPNTQHVGNSVNPAGSSTPASPGLSYPGSWSNTTQGQTYGFTIIGFAPIASPPSLSSSPSGHESTGYLAPTATAYGIAFALLRTAAATNRQAIWTWGSNWNADTVFADLQTFRAARPVATIKQTLRLLPSLHTNAQTFFTPNITLRVSLSVRFDNAQAFYAPTVSVAAPSGITVTPSRHDNTQNFFAPKISTKVSTSLLTNAQAFFAPAVKARLAAPLHTNAQTFYAPKIIDRIKLSARFDGAQGFFAPTVTRIQWLRPVLHTNAQAFFVPKISTRLVQGARLDNAQGFFAPKTTAKRTASLHTNVQQFFGPKISLTLKLSARHDNAQQFYAPRTFKAPLTTVLHTNVQQFFAPKISTLVKVSARFDNASAIFSPLVTNQRLIVVTARQDNAQAFYAPSLKQTRTITLPRHNNAQQFFPPTIKALVKPSLHTNAQQFFLPLAVSRAGAPIQAPPHVNVQDFYGPKLSLAFTLARFDNVQAFYAPTVRSHIAVTPVRFDNAQAFYAPLRITARVATTSLLINQQTFHAQKISTRLTQTARHDNGQAFFAPLVNRANAPIQIPLHVNTQQFFGAKIGLTVTQQPGGLSGWNTTGSYVLDTEYVGTHYVTPLTLVQDGAGNLTGVGGSAPYTWTVNSGHVTGNTFEFFATYDTLAINQHHVGTIAPDGTLSGTWSDDYSGGRTGTFTTTSGAAVAAPGGAGFTNAQAFYAPSVGASLHVQPIRHDNAQTFFAPAIKLLVRAQRHDNAQQVFTAKISERLLLQGARHNNAQAFFAPRISARLAPSIFSNAQTFYALKISTRLHVTERLDNEQEIYAPLVNRRGAPIQLPLHINEQDFFGASVSLTEHVPPDASQALRMFLDARFIFNGQARITEFDMQRRTVFMPARVTEFSQQRSTVFRSRLITDGELVP